MPDFPQWPLTLRPRIGQRRRQKPRRKNGKETRLPLRTGYRFIIKTGAAGRRVSLVTAGRYQRMIGTHRCFFFLSKGYRVIATDRRGHGRSTQTGDGHWHFDHTDGNEWMHSAGATITNSAIVREKSRCGEMADATDLKSVGP